jgi:hypothetical protein
MEDARSWRFTNCFATDVAPSGRVRLPALRTLAHEGALSALYELLATDGARAWRRSQALLDLFAFW